MTKDIIKERIAEAFANNIIAEDEFKSLIDIVDATGDDENLDAVFETVDTIIEAKDDLEWDITALAAMLFLEYEEGRDINIRRMSISLENDGWDLPIILDIIDVEPRAIQKKVYSYLYGNYTLDYKFHAIITVGYNDNEYAFCYNKSSNSLSYRVNDSDIHWFNFGKATEQPEYKSDWTDEEIDSHFFELVQTYIAQVLDV